MMLGTKEAAAYLGLSQTYLRNMRQGQHPYPGPQCVRVHDPRGYAFAYAKEALDEWKSKHEIMLAKRKMIRYKRQKPTENEWDGF